LSDNTPYVVSHCIQCETTYGVLSDKTNLRVNILLYPFFLPPGYCFLGLGLETFGIGAVLSLSFSSGICGRIMSYRYH